MMSTWSQYILKRLFSHFQEPRNLFDENTEFLHYLKIETEKKVYNENLFR